MTAKKLMILMGMLFISMTSKTKADKMLIAAEQLTIQQNSAARKGFTFSLNPAVDAKGIVSFLYKVMSPSGAVVLTIPSSYSTAMGSLRWAGEQARDATLYWSTDGSKLVLDESNFRFGGKLYIYNLSSVPPQNIILDKSEVNKFIDGRLVGLRFMVNDGWISENVISLRVVGAFRSKASKVDFSKIFNCEVGKDNTAHLKFIKDESLY